MSKGCIYARLAQLIEHKALNLVVMGLSPRGGRFALIVFNREEPHGWRFSLIFFNREETLIGSLVVCRFSLVNRVQIS